MQSLFNLLSLLTIVAKTPEFSNLVNAGSIIQARVAGALNDLRVTQSALEALHAAALAVETCAAVLASEKGKNGFDKSGFVQNLNG